MSSGASGDSVAREMEKEGAPLSRGAQLHAVPVQDGPIPGSDMGMGTQERHGGLMERDRRRQATCGHVRVHGGGGPAARISRPLNQHSTSDRKEIGFADGRSGTCFVHITEHQENVKFT